MLYVLSSKAWLKRQSYSSLLYYTPSIQITGTETQLTSWPFKALSIWNASDICYSWLLLLFLLNATAISRNLVSLSRTKCGDYRTIKALYLILYPWSYWQTFWPVWPIKTIHMKLPLYCRHQTVISLITNLAFGHSVQPLEGMGEIQSNSSGIEAPVWSIAAEESARHRLTRHTWRKVGGCYGNGQHAFCRRAWDVYGRHVIVGCFFSTQPQAGRKALINVPS